MIKKKCNVVMLATEKVGVICLDKTNNWLYKAHNKGNNFNHLYITSDEETKQGNFAFDPIDKTVGICGNSCNKDCKKIIATTDLELNKIGIAKIPQGFIEKYIDLYNKNNHITEVNVEYEMKMQFEKNPEFYGTHLNNKRLKDIEVLRLRSDNSIIIHKVKDSFTLEEMKRSFECGRNFQLTGENNFQELINSL